MADDTEIPARDARDDRQELAALDGREATAEEVAESQALNAWLSGGVDASPSTPVRESAGLLRLVREGELQDERRDHLERKLVRWLREKNVSQQEASFRRWYSKLWPAADVVCLGIAALVLVVSTRSPSAPSLAGASELLPVPSVDLLAAQAAWVSRDTARSQVDTAMRHYRARVLETLERR